MRELLKLLFIACFDKKVFQVLENMENIKVQQTNEKRTYSASDMSERWQIRGVRGAITVSHNSAETIAFAIDELLDVLVTQNYIDPADIVSVIFSATADLDALFPASVARRRPGWEKIPLLDVQQMRVKNSLPYCIRVLIYLNTSVHQDALRSAYLRKAASLRPDLALEKV